jgi:GNAT superfamily N-acetyltransferase
VREVGEESSSSPEIEFADLRQRGDLGLLRDVYDRLFLPSILLAEERQSFELWLRRLATPAPPPPEPYVTAVAAGVRLSDPERRQLAGYLFLESYRRSRVVLMSYIGVDPAFRRQGIARRMFEFAKTRIQADPNLASESLPDDAPATGRSARAIFAEIHVPGGIDVRYEPMDTLARVKAFAALGAAVVPLRYIQPALEAGQPFGRSLMLLMLPAGGETDAPVVVRRSVLLAFLTEYYQSCGFATPSDVPEFRSVASSIAAAANGSPDFALPAACAAVIGVVRVAAE